MRLKKLIIQGFKSFADKTTIEIKEGITAIVGPNGSGKSNISDAIRWVLGEQSVRNLRGNKMEDVIFAGTSIRKALGYSEVTVIFDNQDGEIPLDYSEIEVSRRMFRSGESEYYLNKSSCRLKDIRELFMDTGVGKDGYSIIGQGRIDEILSNRPEDRRSIFEEAAGIVKYKSKKQEAEKKLEKTDANLLRIKDLVFELSNQLVNLEEQSNKAIIFTDLYSVLKELEISLFIRDIDRINAAFIEIDQKKEALFNKLNEENLEKEAIEGNFNSLKLSIEDLESKLDLTREKRLSLSNTLDKKKNQLDLINEQEKFNNKDINRLVEEINFLENRNKTILEENQDLEEKTIEIEESYLNFKSSYDTKVLDFNEKLSEINLLEEKINIEKNLLINLYNKSSQVRSNLNTIESFNSNINQRIQQLEKEIELIDKDKLGHLTEHKELSENEGVLQEELSVHKKDLSLLNDNLNKLNIKLDLLYSSLNKEKLDLESKTTSLEILKNMELGYEGYYKGVKSILKARKQDKSLEKAFIGIVADLMKIDKNSHTQ